MFVVQIALTLEYNINVFYNHIDDIWKTPMTRNFILRWNLLLAPLIGAREHKTEEYKIKNYSAM